MGYLKTRFCMMLGIVLLFTIVNSFLWPNTREIQTSNVKNCLHYPEPIATKTDDDKSEPFTSWEGQEPESLSEWQEANELKNSAFQFGKEGVPNDWHYVLPNKAIAPHFSWEETPNGKMMLTAKGTGYKEAFAYVKQMLNINPGWYRFKVRFRVEGITDINRHLIFAIVSDGNTVILNFYEEGNGWIIGSVDFPGPPKRAYAECRLYFRYSPWGKVWWDRVSLVRIEEPPPRIVRIGVATFNGNMSWWSDMIDQAGAKQIDIMLLPEFFNSKDPRGAEDIATGPSFQFLAEKAKKWNMYITTSIYEKRGAVVYNTAPLYDRQGNLVNTYEKNELFEPELEAGASPGIGYKVVQTDFAKVGFMTCYDSWFPETSRLLAYKGAEIIMFPSVAYYYEMMPARAADNGVWIAAASQGTAASVWDPSGASCEELNMASMRSTSRRAPISILSCEPINPYVKIATISMNIVYHPHWFGTGDGPFRSSPGSNRVRQSLIEPIEDLIAEEARNWKGKPDL